MDRFLTSVLKDAPTHREWDIASERISYLPLSIHDKITLWRAWCHHVGVEPGDEVAGMVSRRAQRRP